MRHRAEPPFADGRKRRSSGSSHGSHFNPNQPRGGNGRWIASGQHIEQTAQLAGKDVVIHTPFANVSRPGELSKLAGVDVRGFRHAVSNQSISHVLKNHGNPKVEEARGQIAVQPGDFQRLPDIIKNGIYRPAGHHKSTQPRFVITAVIDGRGYHYVGEVRAGKRRLDMVSLRIKAGEW